METVAISLELPEETVRELDALAKSKHCSRAEVVQEAVDKIVWQARIAAIPEDDPTPDEVAAIARARAVFARGEYVSLEELLRDMDC